MCGVKNKKKRGAAAAFGQKGRVCGPNRRIGIPGPLVVGPVNFRNGLELHTYEGDNTSYEKNRKI